MEPRLDISSKNNSHISRIADSLIDARDGKYRLIVICAKTLMRPILSAIPPRLILVAFTICQPLLLNRFLLYLEGVDEDLNIGYGLVAAYGLVYVGMAISSAFYYHKAFRMATMLRGLLITAIFNTTTRISLPIANDSASVTLMSTDVGSIQRYHNTGFELIITG